MTPTLTLTDVSGSTLTEAVCLSFRLEKERYTPGSSPAAAISGIRHRWHSGWTISCCTKECWTA